MTNEIISYMFQQLRTVDNKVMKEILNVEKALLSCGPVIEVSIVE